MSSQSQKPTGNKRNCSKSELSCNLSDRRQIQVSVMRHDNATEQDRHDT